MIAARIVGLCRGYARSLTVELGVCLEGRYGGVARAAKGVGSGHMPIGSRRVWRFEASRGWDAERYPPNHDRVLEEHSNGTGMGDAHPSGDTIRDTR